MISDDESYQKVIAAKLSALLAIGILSFICGIIPYHLLRARRDRFPASHVHKVASGVICFSGGTLLGVTFLHLMPEVREKIERLQGKGLSFPESLPLSDIIAMSGFFGVYVLDELMHLCVEWYSVRVRKVPEKEKIANTGTGKVCSQLPYEVSAFSLDKHENSKHQVSISRRSNHHASPVTACVCREQKPTVVEEELMSVSPSHTSLSGRKQMKKMNTGVDEPRAKLHSLPHISGLITIAALSFHDIFEGMAVGVENDLNSILFLYLSIASHKYAIAFCIGMDLVLTGSRLKMIVLSMMTFSVVSPIGVFVGMLVVSQGPPDAFYEIDTPASVVLQGIAGGTLIYIVCFEVLQREGTDTHTKGIQNVALVILGFLVTLGFKVLLGHKH